MESDILFKFFRGETDEEENAGIKEWLEESPENRTFFLNRREFFDALLLSPDYPEEKEEVAESIPLPREKRRPFFREILKIASAAAITLFVVWIYSEFASDTDLRMQTIHVPAGQRVNVVLPDGSDIWLNARTTLQYPLQFGKKERTVKLDGEAFFTVAEDKKKPFVVEALDKKIKVLGTEFNVSAYSEKPGVFEVALMEGSVEILPGQNEEGKPVLLIPNYKAYLKDGKLNTQYISDLDVYRWKEGLICFNNESFLEIIRKFEDCYGIKIEVENKKIKDRIYTGKFRISDGVDYALRVLQKDIRFRYERDDENYIIYIK
ncbi:MAG TPA: anti-sigma factor [Dysgonomonas sp.]|nr:anti-sigma factor [Dysgonomonas sp.]